MGGAVAGYAREEQAVGRLSDVAVLPVAVIQLVLDAVHFG